jgi:Fic family protein
MYDKQKQQNRREGEPTKMSNYIPINLLKYPKKQEEEGYLDIAVKLTELNEMLMYVENLPVMPTHAHKIRAEEKIKAIRGTTAIEGNVLEESEIQALLEGKEATSLADLENSNSGKVHEFIIDWSLRNPDGMITEQLVRQIHTTNTRDIPYPNNEPGKYRNFEVTYGYPPKKTPLKTQSEIESEVHQLVDWINDDDNPVFPILPCVIKGIIAHYAISRIHPFADGNGRTARAIEALIFFHKAKIPDYSFYGMANYCYRNRDTYIAELAKVDMSGDISDLLIFCLNGFHESISYVKNRITNIISELLFMDYVHFLRRDKRLSKVETEVIDLIVRLREIPYVDYQKRHFLKVSDESKRRYLNKLMRLHLITIREKDGKRHSIVPNLGVLRSVRRMV